MPYRSGEADTRLVRGAHAAPPQEIRRVLALHSPDPGRPCQECGHQPTKDHPRCLSQETAKGLLRGHRPKWKGVPARGAAQRRPLATELDVDQMGLFALEKES